MLSQRQKQSDEWDEGFSETNSPSVKEARGDGEAEEMVLQVEGLLGDSTVCSWVKHQTRAGTVGLDHKGLSLPGKAFWFDLLEEGNHVGF